MDKRLLDVDEMIDIVGFAVDVDFELCEAQDAKTLREVGEWLENNSISHSDKWGNEVRGLRVQVLANLEQKNDWSSFVDALKQGRMPE